MIMVFLVIFSIFEMEKLTVKAQTFFTNDDAELGKPSKDEFGEVKTILNVALNDNFKIFENDKFYQEQLALKVQDDSATFSNKSKLESNPESSLLYGNDIEKLEFENFNGQFDQEANLASEILTNEENVDGFINQNHTSKVDGK